jgi:hypothetical protein
MPEYLFVREDVFYMIELGDDTDAIENAHCNPGTVRVEALDFPKPRIVWEQGKMQ